MLNELLGWNTHPIGLVSPWSETPENFLFCLCFCVSFPLSVCSTPHPVWGCREKPSWEERVLTRSSPCWCPDLGLLAPRAVRKLIAGVYSTESIIFSYGIPGWQIQIHLFWKLKKRKMNARKLKKLSHFLGIFEISQNWSFFWFHHLMNWRHLYLENVLLQPCCLKDSIGQSLM